MHESSNCHASALSGVEEELRQQDELLPLSQSNIRGHRNALVNYTENGVSSSENCLIPNTASATQDYSVIQAARLSSSIPLDAENELGTSNLEPRPIHPSLLDPAGSHLMLSANQQHQALCNKVCIGVGTTSNPGRCRVANTAFPTSGYASYCKTSQDTEKHFQQGSGSSYKEMSMTQLQSLLLARDSLSPPNQNEFKTAFHHNNISGDGSHESHDFYDFLRAFLPEKEMLEISVAGLSRQQADGNLQNELLVKASSSGDSAKSFSTSANKSITPSMHTLRHCMVMSRSTQTLLQEWDKANGLPRSHSVTMTHSNRSRRQLEEGKILPKWNGKPLIRRNDEVELMVVEANKQSSSKSVPNVKKRRRSDKSEHRQSASALS